MKILLISGHGAGDCGARGCGYKEADLTRELVNIVAPKLRKYATVDIYNQDRNAYKDVCSGTFQIGKYDYVLEFHFNAFNISANGTECFVVPEEKGITVEQAIMKNMGKFFKLRDNDNIFDGVKRTRFAVIKKVKKLGMSGALLETCFIDNPNDMATYQRNKDAIADGIVDGIAKGFGLKEVKTTTPTTTKKSVDEIAKEVLAGKWGNGAERKRKLTQAGYNYAEVQAKVNALSGAKPTTPKKSVDEIAREVIQGKHGNGDARRKKIESMGYNYAEVQKKVNQLLK